MQPIHPIRYALLLLSLSLLATSLYAQNPSAPETERVTPAPGSPAEPISDPNAPLSLSLNFQDASLQAVLEYLSDKAGLVIIADEPLDGRMTVISRQPLCLDEAVSLINSVLMEKGLAAVRMERTLRVVTLDKAKTMNIPVTAGNDPNTITAGDDIVTHVIPVRYADVTKLKENLVALLPEYATLEANEDGNALIVTDTTANIKRLMQIIQALDTHMSLVAEIKVFRLTSADATTTADLINKVFAEDTTASSSSRGGSSGRGGPGGRGGPFEMMMRMRGGDRGGSSNQGGASTSKATGKVTAVGDERTNSVVVRGPDEALSLAEEVIKALDTSSADILDVKVVQLKYADADNVADLVNEVFGKDRETSQDQGRGGPMMMFRGPGGGSRGSSDQGQSSIADVVAASDDRTNSVVVTGPTDMLQVIADVIMDLDSPNADIADVKVFHLEYADAENAANLVNEVFGEERNTGSNSNDRNQNIGFRGPGGRGGPGGGGQQTTTSSAVSVVASADERTNSIVVSGPTDTLEVISEIMKELDANPEQERQLFIYKLKNAEAANLMDVLNNLFSQLQDLNTQGTNNNQRFQGQQGGAGGNAGSSSSTSDLDEEVYFEADETTNSLVILTSSKNYEMIKPIIEELDEPVQQVLIKVLFAEVTHDNTIDLGTEFSILNIGSGGSIAQDFGLSAPSASEGIRFNWLDSNLEVTLRALQETGKLNVLSRPYILTSDNETANINVGEVVPFADGTTLSDGGTQSTTVDYRNVGIELEVTPSINPEGLVIMQINPTISETTGRTVQINEDLSAEVYAERSSVSKVAVRDGQTIVIGGLIEDTIKQTHSKVPLLGDIPGLGALFRRTVDQTVKTELLIFLTPTVADTDEELAAISDQLGALNTIPLEGDLAKDPAYKRYIKTLPETAPER